MKKNKTHRCLNCGSIIKKANYCPNCGQLNTDKRLSLKQFIKDFFGDYFTFDSKFFRSLFPLLTKPGYLTKEYVSGKRVNYIFPLRLYIFTTFLFFFIIAINAKIDQSYLNNEIEKLNKQTNIVDSLILTLNGSGYFIHQDSIPGLKAKLDSSFMLNYKKHFNNTHITYKTIEDSSIAKSKIGKYINKKVQYFANKGDEGVPLILKEIVNQIPKVLFLLLPVFALILKLLYVRHKVFYIEHLVFAFHFHTFIFLLILVPIFFTYWYVVILTILSIFVYMFLALKNVYQQKTLKTFIKLSFLTILYLIVLIPAAFFVMFLTIISV